ncbi:MAG: hypothetical protein V4757_04370 [Pseudomonadota bacterium]
MAEMFASICPTVFAELRDALLADEHVDLAEKLATVRISRCTFAEEDEIGYVYFVRRPPSLHFASMAAPVAETVDFFNELGLNLDVDHDGDLFGLEFLARPELVAGLRSANEL